MHKIGVAQIVSAISVLVLSISVFSTCALAQNNNEESKTQRQWVNAAQAAIGKKDYALAAADFQQAIAGGYNSFRVMYDLACVYAMENETERAMNALEKSADLGLRDVGSVQSDTDLSQLHKDSRWQSVVAKVDKNTRDYHAAHNDPNGFKFITSDVDLFWQTYDQAVGASNPAKIWDNNYLAHGTVGLQGFIVGRIESGAKLVRTINGHPKFYAAIRENTLHMASVEPTVRAAMRKFKTIYKDANFPNVYLVVGAFNSGGTSTDDGLVLGTEIFALGPKVPVDELDSWRRSVVKTSDTLPNIIAHELMHFQQNYEASDMLGQVIKEGSADFLASLVSEGNFNQPIYDYGYAHESQLKTMFLQDVTKNAIDNWLYGGDKTKDRPADLGYFMGYRITQAYYEHAADKTQAIIDILNIKDFNQFLEKSGYFK